MQETEFWRNCPDCKEKIFHKNANFLKEGIDRNSLCRSCYQFRQIQYPSSMTLCCKICLNEIQYTSLRLFRKSYRKSIKNSKHPRCLLCTEKLRKNPSEKQKLQRKTFGKTATENRKTARVNRLGSSLTRLCPSCQTLIFYKEVHSRWLGDQNNSLCASCARKCVWDQEDSPYRTEEFYEKAMKGWKTIGNVSKGERSLAEYLNSQIDDGFVLNEFNHRIGPYFPDIIHFDKKLIIEFYGDGIHGNPVRFGPDDVLGVNKTKVSEVWERDAKRQKFLEDQGWVVFVVWASDWERNSKQVGQNITNLLNITNASKPSFVPIETGRMGIGTCTTSVTNTCDMTPL